MHEVLLGLHATLCGRQLLYWVTNDVERRVADHKAARIPGCYTQTRLPVDLVYSTEPMSDVDAAIRFEKRIKGWSRAKNAALVRNDWEEIKRLSNAKKNA